MTFRAPNAEDKDLGAKAADMLRDRIQDKFSQKKVYVLPTKDVASTLEQSGFPPNDTLPPSEEKSLANLLHADNYVTGTVTQSGPLYTVDAKLVLSRDNEYAQPLPIQKNRDLGDALDDVSKQVREAMKQLEGEQTCRSKAYEGKVADALSAARRAVADYPASTLARLCIANVNYALYSKATTHADSLRLADSTLAVTNEILRYDSLNVPALQFATELYKLRGDSARSRASALTLVKADPSNSKLVEEVINELAATGHAQDAIPLVKDMLDRNPGDPASMHTAFSVYYAAEDYTDLVALGPELVRVDTAAADSTYFSRMALAQSQLKAPQKAAEIMAQATAKYPTRVQGWINYYRYLSEAGQTQQALDALKHAADLDPEHQLLPLAGFYARQNPPQLDTVYVLLSKYAALPGLDSMQKETAAKFASSEAGAASRAFTASMSDADFDQTLKFAKLSDQLSPNDLAKVIGGTAILKWSQKQLQNNVAAKNCSVAQNVKENLAYAQTAFSGISPTSTYGGQTKMFLGIVTQFTPSVNAQIKQFCK